MQVLNKKLVGSESANLILLTQSTHCTNWLSWSECPFQKGQTHKRNWFEFDDWSKGQYLALNDIHHQLGIQILSEQSVYLEFIFGMPQIPSKHPKDVSPPVGTSHVGFGLKLSRIKLQFHRTVSVALKHVHGLYKHRQGNMTTWMASLSN